MDWLVIDAEHGPAGWETVEEIVRAMKGTEVTPVVRVPANDAAFIKKALDRGGHGVVVPLVNTAAHAAAAVAAAKFPPDGIRGVAGGPASRYGLDLADYVAHWDPQGLGVWHLEAAESAQNPDLVAAVPPGGGVVFGPH